MLALKLQSEKFDDIRKRADEVGQAQNVAKVGSRGAANFLRDWFFGLDKTRANKLGGPRTHFFANAARSVQNPVFDGGKSFININSLGLAQRYLGGPIKAGVGLSSYSGKPTEFLALPARREAYGKTPKQFPDLRFIPTRSGGGMLVQALQTAISIGKKGVRKIREIGGLVMFWLVKEVDQKPDHSIMPSDEAILDAALTPAENYLARRLAS